MLVGNEKVSLFLLPYVECGRLWSCLCNIWSSSHVFIAYHYVTQARELYQIKVLLKRVTISVLNLQQIFYFTAKYSGWDKSIHNQCSYSIVLSKKKHTSTIIMCIN